MLFHGNIRDHPFIHVELHKPSVDSSLFEAVTHHPSINHPHCTVTERSVPAHDTPTTSPSPCLPGAMPSTFTFISFDRASLCLQARTRRQQ